MSEFEIVFWIIILIIFLEGSGNKSIRGGSFRINTKLKGKRPPPQRFK